MTQRAATQTSPTRDLNAMFLDELFPTSPHIEIPWSRRLFPPRDFWTGTLATGLNPELDAGSFDGTHIVEYGSGTGVVSGGLRVSKKGGISSTAVDITDVAATATHRFLAGSLALTDVFTATSDLLANVPASRTRKINKGKCAAVWCLPQLEYGDAQRLAAMAEAERELKKPEGVILEKPAEPFDPFSHYYIGDGRPSDKAGLGLNERAIQETNERLPNADIFAIFAGRPGFGNVRKIFTDNKRDITVIHKAMVPHHVESSLAIMAEREVELGQDFEFFADPNGKIRLNAAQAEARRGHEELYHWLYVVKSPALKR